MGKPLAGQKLHMGKCRFEGGILRAAGIDAELNGAIRLPHVANTHLGEMYTILAALDAVIIFPAAEPIPHGVNGCVDGGCCPIGVAHVGGDRA